MQTRVFFFPNYFKSEEDLWFSAKEKVEKAGGSVKIIEKAAKESK